MLDYVLTVSTVWEQCCNVYIGTFADCTVAQLYYDQFLHDVYKGMSCLHKDFVLLPPDHVHTYIEVPTYTVIERPH